MIELLDGHKPYTSRPEFCRVCGGNWPCAAVEAVAAFQMIAEMAEAHKEEHPECRGPMAYITELCR